MPSTMYNPDSQKKYNEKSRIFTVSYRPKESNIALCIDKAVEASNISANAWIKQAILEKLKRDRYIDE